MAIREIRKKGDPCLEKVCHPVTEFNERCLLYTSPSTRDA